MPPNPWDPDHWFLTESDLPAFTTVEGTEGSFFPIELVRGRTNGWKRQNNGWGIANADLALLLPYTTGNKVTPLIDGKNFMGDLAQVLGRLGAGDMALLAGWDFWSGRWLTPDAKQNVLAQTLADLNQAGVIVQVFSWAQAVKDVAVTTAEFESKLASLTKPVRLMYRDPALGGKLVTHHQKALFLGPLRDSGKAVAYVGGIDLALDRWATNAHDNTGKPERLLLEWHDVQLRVEGDAVIQLWANFAERWAAIRGRPPGGLAPTPVPVFKTTSPGTHSVQVLRTVAEARTSEQLRFMPFGERTVLAALLKAISKAECYIYIEEQFFWISEVTLAIRAAMDVKPTLRVIVVLAAETDMPGPLGSYNFYLRTRAFHNLLNTSSGANVSFGPLQRVYAYALHQAVGKEAAIYVHSKLIIIDDRYVSVGSANINRRSMSVDTEITLAVVDEDTIPGKLSKQSTTVCRFAKELREQLWREHLGQEVLPDDPIDVLDTMFPPVNNAKWPRNTSQQSADTKVHHLRCYVNVPGSQIFLPDALQPLADRSSRRVS
jgi:hypothetical protein